MLNLSILLCILATISVAFATDYCSSEICGNGEKHIACGHSGNFAASCPSNAKMVTINDSLKHVLVKAHNAKRNKIAGGGDARHKPACRMATMKWDDELASVAAFNVKQCKMAHDKCHNTDTFKLSGQNLAWQGYHGKADHAALLKKIVEMWYSEVKDSKQSYIDSYPSQYSGPAIGHFTVMMVDRNIRLGCAAATYTRKSDPYSVYLVACNYASTNILTYPIYAKCRKAASSCTTGTNPHFGNLCSAAEKYDINNFVKARRSCKK